MCDEIIQKDSPFDPIQTTKTERKVEDEEEESKTKQIKKLKIKKQINET